MRRPTNPAHFNGTVIVEWMNVSAGESAPDWDFLNPMLMRDGYAYVGVSAQALGVDGGQSLLGTPNAAGATPSGGLVGGEPARYGTLHHPGDQYALDMFAQIGQALRAPHAGGAGRPQAQARPGRRRVAVRLLPDHVRRCPPAADQRLRRHLHPQPGRFGRVAWRAPPSSRAPGRTICASAPT